MMGGRVLQAIGAGILMPLGSNVIVTIFPPEKRGVAMGTMGIAMILAPAIDNIIWLHRPKLSLECYVLYDVYLRITCFLIWISMVQNLSKQSIPKQIIVVSYIVQLDLVLYYMALVKLVIKDGVQLKSL